MKSLKELYSEDIYTADNFIDSVNLQVSMKLSGISFQVYFNSETEKYEYHTHTDELSIGPKISKLTKYFCKDITNAISVIEENKDIVNNYRFIDFILYNKEMYLLSFMLKDQTDIIDDYNSLISVANQFKCKPSPIIWNGRLSKNQQSTIRNLMSSNQLIDSNEFKNMCCSIFGVNSQTEPTQNFYALQTLKEIDIFPGFVFTVNFGDKIAKVKLNDPNYEHSKREEKARKELNKAQHKADYELLYRCMCDWLELKAKQESEKHMESLQKNFINMCENRKILMKLIHVAAKLPVRTDPIFMLQVPMLDEGVQALIRKHGTPMRTLVEQYLLIFYKKKEFDYDKELIKRIHKIVDMI